MRIIIIHGMTTYVNDKRAMGRSESIAELRKREKFRGTSFRKICEAFGKACKRFNYVRQYLRVCALRPKGVCKAVEVGKPLMMHFAQLSDLQPKDLRISASNKCQIAPLKCSRRSQQLGR